MVRTIHGRNNVFASLLPNEETIDLYLHGPRGGGKSSMLLDPFAMRQLARNLNEMADVLEKTEG